MDLMSICRRRPPASSEADDKVHPQPEEADGGDRAEDEPRVAAAFGADSREPAFRSRHLGQVRLKQDRRLLEQRLFGLERRRKVGRILAELRRHL